MRRALTVAAAVLAISGQAHAADLPQPGVPVAPVPAIYNWNGFYIGVNGGWGDGLSNWLPSGQNSYSVAGYVFGGTAGYNYQVGAYVWGIEGDFDWTHVVGNSGQTCGAISDLVPPTQGCASQSDWLATFRGRFGYAWDNILLYGTGGVAFGNVKVGLIPPSTFDSTTETGWTIGTGLEVGFAPNWTAKVEYLFVQFPNATCSTVGSCGAAAGSAVSFNENVIRVGINFKFGAW